MNAVACRDVHLQRRFFTQSSVLFFSVLFEEFRQFLELAPLIPIVTEDHQRR